MEIYPEIIDMKSAQWKFFCQGSTDIQHVNHKKDITALMSMVAHSSLSDVNHSVYFNRSITVMAPIQISSPPMEILYSILAFP